jgi:hypothetical protein
MTLQFNGPNSHIETCAQGLALEFAAFAILAIVAEEISV